MIALLLFLSWGLLSVLAWVMAYHAGPGAGVDDAANDAVERPRTAQFALTVIVLAVAAASIAYRAVRDHGLQQTAALFIGVPVVLAVVVIFAARPRSATGVACKAVTVAMLLSVLFLWEGFLCVVMAAPLFYLVAIAISYPIDRRRERLRSRTLYSSLVVLAFAPLSLEGVTELTTFDRHAAVTATSLVHASAADVERALVEPPRFDRALPRYLRSGFPRPVASRIERRDAGGMRWVITMRGGETFLNGTEPRTGDLTLVLEEHRPGLMRWRAASDTSHMTHFLTFRESIVSWEPVDFRTTRVTWEIRYERGLDPAWYFGPMERCATWLAAGYLIDAVATP
ncbi:MAG TPA: SRPBCC family protein [Vicinamibacterales bacterium]|nr:SRPBCC family protein [Vicinamibacterales bacterium]